MDMYIDGKTLMFTVYIGIIYAPNIHTYIQTRMHAASLFTINIFVHEICSDFH